MRRILYPYHLDRMDLRRKLVDRNAQIDIDGRYDVEDLAYALVQVQRRIGTLATEEPSTLEYRLQQIEAALGITPALPPTETATVNAFYAGQWQAGYTVLAAEDNDIVLTIPAAEVEAYYVRAYIGTVELAVTASASSTGLHISVPLLPELPYAQVEWAVKGNLAQQTSPRVIEGSEATVPAGTAVNFSPAFSNANDYIVVLVSVDDGSGGGTAMNISKGLSSTTFYPAVNATVTYKLIQVTQ